MTTLGQSDTLLARIASDNATKVENFSREISEELADIRERIEVIRRKISENQASPKNFSGFLRFDIDTYMCDFNEQIAKVNECL